MKVETPPLIDSFIWFFPPIFTIIVLPFVKVYIDEKNENKFLYRKILVAFFSFLSSIGIFLLAEAESLTLYFNGMEDKKSSMVFAIFGFIFVDVSNEILAVFIFKIFFLNKFKFFLFLNKM